jgi:hypothetical protein
MMRVSGSGGLVFLTFLGLGLAVGLGGVCGAQENKPTVVTESRKKPQAATDVKVPLMSGPVRLGEFAGMKPSAKVKAEMAEIDGFIESSPTDGKAASQKTVAYVGHTASTLYVVFLCFDTDAKLIRGHLARRENVLADDSVTVLLDTFEDHRRGVLFQTNPVGVQADAAWTEGNGPDYSYDQVWDSDGRVTSQGWMAEFAIPFRSLRYRPGEAGWGVVLTRSLPRNSETDSWPHISTNVTGTLPQEGTLRGIGGVTGSHNLQLNPYALAQNEKTLEMVDLLHPFFSDRRLEGTIGGDAKAILKESIVVDATVNPDFSQVESDQPQFTVNQRYPVYFPELRPFFLENANYFATPINLLYTRNIVHPEFGGRVTGKVGGTNVGLLSIDDRAPGQAAAPGDPEFGKRALFAVGRVSEDLGKGSSVGLIYTDEEFAGGWNRIGGLDFTARLNDKWTAQGQMVESSSWLPGVPSLGIGSSYSAGPASYLEFSRQGHAFNFDNTTTDYSTGFGSQVGFIQTADLYKDHNHTNYQWYPKHSVLQSIGLESDQQIAFDHQGNRISHYSTFDPFFTLKGNTVLAPLVGENSDTVGPQNGYAIPGNLNFTENFVGGVLKSAPIRQLNVNITTLRGGNVNYNPAGTTPSLLNQDYLQALVTVQPFRSLTVDNTYLLDREHEADGGADAYESQILRTKINYQFTRAFSARVIVEYDSTLVNPKVVSLVRTKEVSTEALLTWLPHPGTAIYLGYNNDEQNLDRTLCNRVMGGGCDVGNTGAPRGSNYLQNGKQIFLKVSYLLRF